MRDGTRLPRHRHFKFYYPTALGLQEYAPPSVMLDVVAERQVIHALESKPIVTGFLIPEREVKVKLPTVESLLGDKLTAFPPTTTGVPLRRADGTPGDVVQAAKQLFDVGLHFQAAANGAEVIATCRRAHAVESTLSFRGAGILACLWHGGKSVADPMRSRGFPLSGRRKLPAMRVAPAEAGNSARLNCQAAAAKICGWPDKGLPCAKVLR